VQADSVSTSYSYDGCNSFRMSPIGNHATFCDDWSSIAVESVPVIPPFVYNHQCPSVLLTSYIPVLIIGYSIQLVWCFLMPILVFQASKWLNPTEISYRQIVGGVSWPEFWLDNNNNNNNADNSNSDLEDRKKEALENDPTILLNSQSFLCFDVLNNMLIMLTFGLCSPILAAAVACVAVAKTNMVRLLVGRFTAVLRKDDSRSPNVHFALVALTKLPFPLREVLRESFWLIVWISSCLFSLMCWDIASDDVGLVVSIWIPITVICYPIILWTLAYCSTNRPILKSLATVKSIINPIANGYEKEKKNMYVEEGGVEVASLTTLRNTEETDEVSNNPMHSQP
jgi:hypothetical protein